MFLYTKKILGDWANNCKYIKINDFEYQNSKDYITDILNGKLIHTKGWDCCDFQGKQYNVKKV